MTTKYVIIGNGVAGTTAAEQIKKADAQSKVTLIGDEKYPLYNRVALPPFLKGAVKEDKVLMRTSDMHAQRGIDLFLETRVKSVHLEEKAIVTETGKTLPFDKLLVATGGKANSLNVPGSAGTKYIYTFQTLDDTKEISARIDVSKSAAVIGGSFIAYELAEAFRFRRLETVWIMRGPYFLRRLLDEDGGQLVDNIARDHGVTMVYNQEMKEVGVKAGEVSSVTVADNRRFDVDMVGIGLGLTLNTDLLKPTGVPIGRGIITDQGMRTNHPNVFAAGDVAEFYEPLLKMRMTMGTWNNAVSHGKVAGANMAGGNEVYNSVPTYTSGLFSSKIAVMGMTPEVASDIDSVSQVDFQAQTYRRVFFLKRRVVGAVLIGDMRPRRELLRLIRSGDRVDPSHVIPDARMEKV